VSRDGSDLFITGVNVHIRNGAGHTDAINGTGNLIVGYNESRSDFGLEDERTGSHNVAIGALHNYGGYSGLAAGWFNSISGNYATALGFRNGAFGDGATVTGGNDNRAIGSLSTVAGGIRNAAEGLGAAVMGGDSNFARGPQSTVTGGAANLNEAYLATIGGGSALQLMTERGWAAGGIYAVPGRGPGVFFAP
jgi:hypothetical protein